MGCGKSFPFCNGSIMPWTGDIHAWIEFGHRLLVFSVSVLLTSLSVTAWRKYKSNRKVQLTIISAILGIILESTLGTLSVFFVSPPAIMAMHMGIALISFGALVVLTMTIYQIDYFDKLSKYPGSKKISRLIWITLMYLYLAIYFGAYVTSSGAGAYFNGFMYPNYTRKHFLLTLLTEVMLLD